MSKAVQIPEELFFEICRYHLLDLDTDDAQDAAQAIQDGLRAKLDAMQRRQLYTAYKDTKAAPEAREAARQAYLDLVGMLPGFRWEGLEPPV